MPSKRSNQPSRGDGVPPLSPFIRQEKEFSDLNRFRHRVLASSVLLEGENLANFELVVKQHLDRFQPADGVEFGVIEELVASYWRLRRAWNIETYNLDQQISFQPLGKGGVLAQLANAFDAMAVSPAMAPMQRYQTRLQLSYTRALQTLKLIRAISPSAPYSPVVEERVPEQPAPAASDRAPNPTPEPPTASQLFDPESLGSPYFAVHGASLRPPPAVKEAAAAHAARVAPMPPTI